MSDVKRYDCTDGGAQWCQGCYTMTEREYGDWVSCEDYDALAARLASTEQALALRLEDQELRERSLRARLAEAERLLRSSNEYLTIYSPLRRSIEAFLGATDSAPAVHCPDCTDPDCAKGCAYADDDEEAS